MFLRQEIFTRVDTLEQFPGCALVIPGEACRYLFGMAPISLSRTAWIGLNTVAHSSCPTPSRISALDKDTSCGCDLAFGGDVLEARTTLGDDLGRLHAGMVSAVIDARRN